MRRGRRHVPPPLAIVLTLLFAGLWTGAFGLRHLRAERSPLDGMEDALAGLRLQLAGPSPTPAGIVIVAIDDRTVAREGGYPLARDRLAALIDAARAAGARTVALDLLFADATRPAADLALARALGAGPSVLGSAAHVVDAAAVDGVPAADAELRPLPTLAAAASAVGFVNVAADAAGVPRHVPLLLRSPSGSLEPSFALAAAMRHRAVEPTIASESVRLGAEPIPLDAGWHLPLRFYGPRGTVRTVSAADVLDAGARAPRLDGALVIVGATATAVGDVFATTFDPVLPGVEVQATAVSHLLNGDGLRRDAAVRRLDLVGALAVALVGTLALLLLPPVTGAASAVTLLLFALGISWMLLSFGIWASASLPLSAIVPFAAAALVRQVQERHAARSAEDGEAALARLQPGLLTERLRRDPTYLDRPLTHEAAVLFVDLAGFTAKSERIGAERTRAFLKAFHSLAVERVATHGGIVLNLMGDGAMAVFGLDDARPDPAGEALAAAFALVAAVPARLAVHDPAEPPPRLRAGLHHGALILSRLGHEAQQQITVSGDTVNVASRLVEVAKANGACIAATREVLDAAATFRPSRTADMTILAEIRGRTGRKEVCLWRMAPASSDAGGGGG